MTAAALGLLLAVGCTGMPMALTGRPAFTKRPYVQNLTSTSVTIKWETRKKADSRVLYREAGEGDWRSAGDRGTRALHEVKIEGLTPGREYDYRAAPRMERGEHPASHVARFRTPAEEPKELRFVVYGDTRSQPKEHAGVVDAILAREGGEIDFVVHTGDLTGNGSSYGRWDREFFGPAQELLSGVPVYPVLGNHEHNSDNYFDLFALPGNERFYSVEFGPAHILFLDSNWPMKPGSEQYLWLARELAGSTAPWKFAVCHHAPFTSGPHGKARRDGTPKEAPIRELQEYVVPLLAQHGVAMVFAGHDHLYERSEKGGITYITTGGGGGPLHDPERSGKQNPYSEMVKSGKYHYCVVEVDREKVRVSAVAVDGSVIDEVEIAVKAGVGTGRSL